jgi:histone-lysine N-methyltransferase SETMAR
MFCIAKHKKKLRTAIQNKRYGMLTSGIVLIHDHARPHTDARARALLEHFNWELFDHPSYSTNLAPSNYHLFTYPKNWVRSQRFTNNEKLMESVKMWPSSQAADFFDTGIQKLVPKYDICLNSGGDYIEK